MARVHKTAASTYDAVLADIKSVAESLGTSPVNLTKAQYFKLGKFNEWALRKLGGLSAIISDGFGPVERDLGVLSAQSHRRAYVRKLEKAVGDHTYFTDSISAALKEAFEKVPVPRVKKATKAAIQTRVGQREIVAFISDTHFGLDIDPKEVPANEYNWTVACRRMAKFAEQIATYKEEEHRGETPQLTLCLGGDLAQGIIHLSDAGTHLITRQIHGTAWILTQMIDYLRLRFKRIRVVCTPDNHLRLVHKGHDRALAQKWDSFATMLHLALQFAFRDCPDVSFLIPMTPYTEFDVLGHLFWMSHGDTVLNSGNVGRNVQIGRITSDVRALQAANTDKHIRVVMLGHVHTPLYTTLDNGTELVINGTGSGTDSYAQSIGFMSNNPSQVMFEVTKDFPVGDFRKVTLKDADMNAGYDQIIVPYKGDALTNPPRRYVRR